jgi:hypothetical protein
MTAADNERLHAEVDRQLAEVRSDCDGLAARAGVLLTATSIAAAFVTPRIGKHPPPGLWGALLALSIAIVLGIITVSPWLRTGPRASSLQGWKSAGPSARTSSLLYDFKVALITGNTFRRGVSRAFFMLQILATVTAIGIAVWYAVRKLDCDGG